MFARLMSIAAIAAAFNGGAAQAGVVIDATRVVYPAERREVSMALRNTGDAPALIQAWIDTGDPKSKPGEAKVPFVLNPPLFRVDPAKGQTLRLIYSGDPLPADRESVFWLNVLDIPPRAPADPAAPNRLEMAFRHRLKIFFRPARLPGKAAEAARAVTWRFARDGAAPVLEARNPTPFHVSYSAVQAGAGGDAVAAQADMLPPFATHRFALAAEVHPAGPITIKYAFVDDFGAVVEGTARAEAAD